MLKIAIEKERVNEMETVEFPGEIYVIDSMLKVNAAINVLRSAPLVGFDTETRPTFHKGDQHSMSLIQLSTLSECFLFRVNRIGVPQRLGDYLADPSCKKVGLSLHDDFNGLSRVSQTKPAGFVDIQDIVTKFHIADVSLQKVYAILFQQKISKSQRLTNWDAKQLTKSQQRYAAIDAWACINIYNYLRSGEFDPAKSPFIVKEEEKS